MPFAPRGSGSFEGTAVAARPPIQPDSGLAMAVWHHQVGNIHSLRFSRWDANGWSVPDVLPGALPRPAVAGMRSGQNAPQLHMDAQGAVLARWPSGFYASED